MCAREGGQCLFLTVHLCSSGIYSQLRFRSPRAPCERTWKGVAALASNRNSWVDGIALARSRDLAPHTIRISPCLGRGPRVAELLRSARVVNVCGFVVGSVCFLVETVCFLAEKFADMCFPLHALLVPKRTCAKLYPIGKRST